MREALSHRGPDDEGLFLSDDRRIGLGSRRLRIIDLGLDANQPIANEDGTIQLVLNGEIYNFRALRAELEQKGHRFRSNGDAEVVVHLYEEEGARAVARLDGMFALAVWDGRLKQLLLARDRVGKKPLFYYQTDDCFAFGSEIKAFFHQYPIAIDSRAVPQFFIHGFVPSPGTFYTNVKQVEPATTLVIAADGAVTREVYWRLRIVEGQADRRAEITPTAAARTVRSLLEEAVARRLESDVPLGAFLSGGVDSTIVVAVMSRLMAAPVRTFSIGFRGDPAYDETAYARTVSHAFGTDHTEFTVAPSAIDLVQKILWHYDGPFGDASAVPTYLLARLAKERVTVALSGDGGDELFAGYLRFAAASMAERVPATLRALLQRLVDAVPSGANDRRLWARVRRVVRAMNLPLHDRMTRWSGLFFDDVEQLLAPDLLGTLPAIDRLAYLAGEREQMEGLTTLGALLHVNFRSYLLDDLLVKADRCTMAHALELRSPFLDTALVDYVAALPDSMKLRRLTTKVVLRQAFEDILPEAIIKRPKMGFGVPVDAWFRTDLREYVRDLLTAGSPRYATFLSAEYVHRLVSRHQAGEANLGLKLWSLVCFEQWLRELPRWVHQAAPTTSQ